MHTDEHGARTNRARIRWRLLVLLGIALGVLFGIMAAVVAISAETSWQGDGGPVSRAPAPSAIPPARDCAVAGRGSVATSPPMEQT